MKRFWVSEKMGIMLTLTNPRGVPYSVDQANGGSLEERMSYHVGLRCNRWR